MYYEEKIINGVLMWRGTPDGKWKPVSIEIVTKRLIEARQEAKRIYDEQRAQEAAKWENVADPL